MIQTKAKSKRPTYAQEMALDVLAYPDRYLRVLGDPPSKVFWHDSTHRLALSTFRALVKNGWVRKLRIDVDHRSDRRWDIYVITTAGRDALRD